MAANAQQINVHFVHIYRHFAYSLSSIRMVKNSSLSADFSDLSNRLQNSNFIIDKNCTNTQNLLLWLINSLLEKIQIQDPIIF